MSINIRRIIIIVICVIIAILLINLVLPLIGLGGYQQIADIIIVLLGVLSYFGGF